MKLCTDIAPRRDGTVIAQGAGTRKFTFMADDAGDGTLVCDVEDEPSLQILLNTEHFYPFNDDDIESAMALTGTGVEHGADGAGDEDGDEEDEDDGEMDVLGEDASGAALPVEAKTPPAPAAKKHATAGAGKASGTRKRATS